MSIDEELRAAEHAGDDEKADRIRSRLGPRMRLERFKSYPPGPQDETEAQRNARIAATPEADLGESIWFWCQGCETHHSYRIRNAKGESGPIWAWNGDMDKPSFTPSLLIRSVRPRDGKVNPDGSFDPVDLRCHLLLTNGQINYCGDCTHGLKGQVVSLPELS
jgi:hypothetical protein